MGKTIERLALNRGHEIMAKIDVDSVDSDISGADVAIDFSIPGEAFNNISRCFEKNVPIVCGTTGWLDKFDEAVALCKNKNGAFIYASNYSLGVNLFFELNERLANMMAKFSDYTISLEEIHHTQKLDAPSGTAISLAQGIISNSNKKNWKLDVTKEEDTIPIVAKRIENVPGTHTVTYNSIVDEIAIKHTANNRDGSLLPSVSTQYAAPHPHKT